MLFRSSRLWRPQIRSDFSGGENLQTVPELLLPNQFLSGQNCIITAEGALQTRNGKTKVNTTSLGAGGIVSMHRFVTSAGNKYLVVQHGTSLYAKLWDGNGQFTDFGVAIKTGLDVAKLRSVVWKDLLFLTNGVNNVFTFNGTTCADLAGLPPKSKIIKEYADRLFLVDVATDEIRFCNLNDPTVWDVGNYLKIRTADGDKVTAMSPQPGPGLIVAKQNSVWRIHGTSLNGSSPFWGLDAPLTDVTGCMGPDAMLDNGLLLGKDNIFNFNLSEVRPAEETHTSYFTDLILAQKQAAVFGTYTAQRLSVLAVGDCVLCIDHKHNDAITTWKGINANCFVTLNGKDDTGDLLIGDATNGIVYRYSGSTDDGVGIELRFKDGYKLFDVVGEKEIKYVEPFIKLYGLVTYDIQVDCDADFTGRDIVDVVHGTTPYAGWLWDISKWDEGMWDDSEFTISPRATADLRRGTFLSVGLRTFQKIKLLGYKIVIREVGAI